MFGSVANAHGFSVAILLTKEILLETTSVKKTTLVYIVTVAITAKSFLWGQLSYLREKGIDITVVASPDPKLDHLYEHEQVHVKPIEMQREIHFLLDFFALIKLIKLLSEIKPDIVNASTPKAGLLGMLAARLTGVPVRVYQLRGLRLETTTGIRRFVLTVMERIAASCAHWIVCNSYSLRQAYIDLNLAPESKLLVLGAGSSNGVNIKRFTCLNEDSEDVRVLRHKYGLIPEAKVIGFVGRLTRDKGIEDLIQAFDVILTKFPNTYLLLVGALEDGDPLPPYIVERLNSDPQIIMTGFVDDSAPYYQLMDMFAFLSYREGFPNAPLEAAVSGVPTIGYKATGTVDAVVHHDTGLLFPRGDVAALSKGLLMLLDEPHLIYQMGTAARSRAIQEFDSCIVWNNWINFYKMCLEDAGISLYTNTKTSI